MHRRHPRSPAWSRAAAAFLGSLSVTTWAQTETPAPGPAPAPAPVDGSRLDPVEVTGSRPDETAERRRSTAAKTVVEREEILRFGDTRLSDVLKRLPGITSGGPGGGIRMRGLSEGYVLILLDGERLPPGLSLDAIPPEQIERIEILRAPTAETGAQAIAGTINIVTRGGYRRRVNDVRTGLTRDGSTLASTASWSRNAKLGDVVLNGTASVMANRGESTFSTRTETRRIDDGTLVLERRSDSTAQVEGWSLNANGRVEWTMPSGLGQWVATPLISLSRQGAERQSVLTQSIGDPAPYERSRSDATSRQVTGRLLNAWTRPLDDGRVEFKLNLEQYRSRSDPLRVDTLPDSAGMRTTSVDTASRETTITTGLKVSHGWRTDHTLTAGGELERSSRDDRNAVSVAGVPLVTGYPETSSARATRSAAYVQDDWTLNPRWSAQVGVRWEQTVTEASAGIDMPRVTNRNGVWTPLAHTLWKLDDAGRDQFRLALTRSYKAPDLALLSARPLVNTTWPASGPNTPTDADYAGNPGLRPEVATGIDLSFEHQLPGNGLLSASLLSRRIRDHLRLDIALETVPWSDVPRYVFRPRNTGHAKTHGLELEAKFRLSELWPAAPATDVRANVSLYRSRVDGVPGPDNRLDSQPSYSAGFGADHRFTRWPLVLGGNASWNPGSRTRISTTQSSTLSGRWLFDGYALWTLDANWAIRASVSGASTREYAYGSSVDGSAVDGTPVRETTRVTYPSPRRVSLRLEMKL